MTAVSDAYTAALDLWDFLPWWSTWGSAFLAVIGALLPFRWLLAFVPGAGPFLLAGANALVDLLGLVVRAVLVPYLKLLGQGIYRACTSLPGITVAITGAMVFILVGVVIGVRLDAQLVRKANEKTAAVQLALEDRTKERDLALNEISQWEGRLHEQETRAGAAETARKVAEDKARAALAARDRAVARAGGLLKSAGGAPKAGPQAAAGPGLPSLSGLFGGAGK
jgi:hypothetical protein